VTGRLTDAERVAAGLAAAPLRPIPAPGLVVTVWGADGITRALDGAMEALRAIGPDVVQLHTQPDATDAAVIARVRAEIPGVRVWIGAPADTLARTPATAAKRARAWAAQARELGAEALILNGEAAWKGARAVIARDVIAACRDGAPALLLGWTSFDHPRWHRLAWSAILGAGGVDLHLPQVYAAPADGVATRASALSRWSSASRQWDTADVLPAHRLGGARCVPYVQAHHVSVSGTCALLDRAPLASAWALPTRSDAAGVIALRADAILRREAGHTPGRAARYQAAHGLVADGVVGPATLRALGLAR